MGGDEEECPECEQKFVDLRTLSDHFDKNHGSSSEDEDKPRELSSKGITSSRPNHKNNNISSDDLATMSTPESKSLKEPPKIVVVKPRFVEDARVRRVKDISGATIPSKSDPGDPFLSSFLSFVQTQNLVCSKCGSKFSEEEALAEHQKSHLDTREKDESLGITYSRGPKRVRSVPGIKSIEKPEVIDLVDEDPDDPNDPLNQHILVKGLPLVRRGNTVSDGNCWYDAVADQVKLHDIDGVGRNHQQLREEVCQALPNLAQAPMWKKNVFGGNHVKFRKFIARHRRVGEWTDVYGILCQATALHLGRNIMVVGTINSGPGDRGYTTLEGGPGADAQPPLYVGYYQDQHYQSLQRTAVPASLDLGSGAADLRIVAAMGKEMGLAYLAPTVVSDQVTWRNSEDEHVREQRMSEVRQRFVAVEMTKELLYEVIEEVARIGIVREAPKKKIVEVQAQQPLSKKEQEILEQSQSLLDKMISQLNMKLPDQPNQERLEIFQRLGKAETIVEYNLSASQGLVITPKKHKNENSVENRQRTALAPLQLRMGRQMTPTKYKGITSGEVEPAPVAKTKEEKATGGNVYTCIKCGQAFEKINLFVKHFIQNHKDVINANRNSKNFSFSNYWTKSKKGGGKRDEEEGENPEVKDARDGSSNVDGAGDWDLNMDCQIIPMAKPANKKASARKVAKTFSLNEGEFFSQPIEAFSAVYAVEIGDEEVEQAEEVLPMDTFQCVPLTEIKLENPFEELPFNWEGEMEDLLEEKESPGEGLLKVLDLQEEEEVEEILGPTRNSELAVGVILDDILEVVFQKGEMGQVGDDVEELFNEEVLDTSLEMMRHQVYIKDFSWVPLEDQFLHCDPEEKTQAETLLLLRKLKNVEKQREEVKTLMLSSTDEDMTTQLVLRILGEGALPLKADHTQVELATPKLVAAEHCYFMKKKVKSVPASVTRMLTRVRSKACAVSCPPRGSRKLAFSGVQPSAIQVTNNNVIRVRKSRAGGKRSPEKTAICDERRIELVVGGEVTATLASWREEQLENNNREEKVEENVAGLKNEVAEVDVGLVEDMKEEKRREQYRRIQEFKRKKNEEKSILKKRRLEEGKLGGKVEPFDIVKEVYQDESSVEQGLEGQGEAIQHGHSLAKHNKEKTSLSMGELKQPTAKKGIEESLRIRTDVAETTNKNDNVNIPQAEDKSSSLSLAATLAGLEDLLAEDTAYVDSLPDTRDEIFDRVFKDSAARLPSTIRPYTPLQTYAPNVATDLLQAAMSETFTSGGDETVDAGVASIKQENMASPNKKASLFNKGNVYSIKQEVLDGVDVNIKKEPLDPVTSANDLATFFSDFGVAVVKTEPVVPPEMSSTLHMDEDDGEVLFLSSSCQESGVDMVSKCSICFLTFQDAEALAKHGGQHSAAAPLVSSSLKSRVKASHLPTLSLTRVPLPASFKRKVQYDLGEEQAAKVAKVEKVFSTTSLNLINGSSGTHEPRPWSQGKDARDPSESVGSKMAIEVPGQSKGDVRRQSSQLRADHPNMTTLQALDSLLGGGPASEPEVACPVCGKQGFPSLPALRRHLAYHPHNQCQGKANICYICDEKYPLKDPAFEPHITSHLKDLRTASPSQCPACFLNLPNSQLLETHVRLVHKEDHAFPCPNPQCNEVFERRRPLQVHLRSRHPGC